MRLSTNDICLVKCEDIQILTCLTENFVRATSKTWTQDLDSDPEKPGPRKIRTLKNLDPENLEPEKHGINMALKNLSNFRELYFIKICFYVVFYVICCLKICLFTGI